MEKRRKLKKYIDELREINDKLQIRKIKDYKYDAMDGKQRKMKN